MERKLSLYLLALPLAAATWRPVDPAEMAMKSPKIEPNADAEVLYWEVKITDHLASSDIWTTYRNYIRIKVFTEKGAKDQATVEIPFAGKQFLTDVAARTIKPDGTVVEVKNDAIKSSDLLKGRKVRNIKVTSIAFPAVTPGSILEYQYNETHPDEVANYVHLEFSRELPVHTVKYLLKPIQDERIPFQMRVMAFQSSNTPFQAERQGTEQFYATVATNVPSFKSEAFMPPENDVRPWMLIYYEEDKKLTPDKFWKEVGKDYARDFSKELKIDNAIKKAAAEAVAGAETAEQKVDKLLQYCRTNIRNVYGDSAGVTPAERAAFKGNENTAETFKRKLGTGYDINLLFAALAQAAGFEARLARIADRGFKSFSPQTMSRHFLVAQSIAVKLDGNWKFFDAAALRAPKGFLRWQEEGAPALICDNKEPGFVTTPLNGPAGSKITRRADLEVDLDGSIAGKIRIAYTGHRATARRLDLDQDAEAERVEKVREELAQQYAGAEFSDVKVENVTDLDKPLVVAATIKLAGYGQRTGKRMFVQPAFFQAGSKPLFGESARQFGVYFRYPWSEVDRVSIRLPDGMALDQPSAPASFKIGEAAEYKTSMAVNAAPGSTAHELIYTREFTLGLQDQIFFPKEVYPALKKAFDHVHEQDGHTMTLKAGN